MSKSNIKIVSISMISAVSLLFGFFVVRPALATSGECSYHGGVNCAAGASANGDAICNDGAISSVPYSETDECSTTISCFTSNEVTQLTQSLEQQYGTVIQNLENEEQSAIAQIQQQAEENLQQYNNESSLLNQYHGYNSTQGQATDNIQSQEQADIESTSGQYGLSIAEAKSELAQQEEKIALEQCAPQQEAWLNYVSSTDSCYEQNGLTPSCLSASAPQPSTPAAVASSLSAPTNLSATAISVSQINLSWIGGSQTGIEGFQIYRNGMLVATTSNDFYGDAVLTPDTIYTYAINAYDINGNVSPSSNSASATTFAVSNPASPITTPFANAVTLTQNLTIGNFGDNVVALQEFLEAKGFLTLPSGTSNGYFGNLTKQALIAYQSSVGLPDTGYCGPMTRTLINSQ